MQNMRVSIQVGIGVLPRVKPGGRVKKEIKNEGFLMQVFKSWKDINITLFLLSRFLM
jgi:hypothetical protein